jgi:hypothetical protein
MAFGDIKGKSAGTRLSQQFDRAKLEAELESEQASNIEVGDFLSELATAVRFRMKNGQSQGDWIDEPERMFTDGLIFATQQAVASEVKLQITLSLDTSTSMWMNRLMKHAGPAMLAFDRVIRKAIADLPQGSIAYQPFIFHGTARKVPAAFLNSYVGSARKASGEESDSTVWPQIPTQDQLDAAIKAGDLPEGTRRTNFDMSGPDTLIAPLFRAIQEWEKVEGDPNAVRLDIVITDGVFGDTETSVEADDPDSDIDAATAVQEERNGRLRTVLLNFLKLDEWSNRQLPDRCAQFAVDADNLNTAIRDILQEAVADLFA